MTVHNRSAANMEPSGFEIMRQIAVVAIPTYPMQLVTRVQNLVTLGFIGRYGAVDELAAYGLAAMVTNLTGISWLWGMSGALATRCSQDWGAKSYRNVGVELQRGVLVLLCLADVPLMTAWYCSEWWLLALGMPAPVARLVGMYSRVRIPGLVFNTVAMALNRTLMAIGNARINLIMGLVGAVINVLLSAWLIPRYGFVGAAVAACLGDVFVGVGTAILAFLDDDMGKCLVRPTWEALQHWGDFLALSLPSLMLVGVEWWTWDFQSLLAGYVSAMAQATQAVAPLITDLQYAVGQALGSGATTAVGNLLGEGRVSAARKALHVTVLAGFVLSAAQGMIFYALREHLAHLFAGGEEVAGRVVALLPLTLVFSCMDSQQAALTGVLIGAGKQGIAAPVMFVCYWMIGVPLGAALAFGKLSEPWGLPGLWVGMTVAVCLHYVSFSVIAARIDWISTAEEIRKRGPNTALEPLLP